MCILLMDSRLSLSLTSSILECVNWGGSNTFQKRSVSSAAEDTTVTPSGLCEKQYKMRKKKKEEEKREQTAISNFVTALCSSVVNSDLSCYFNLQTCERLRTLDVWPLSSPIFRIEGYLHKHSDFWPNPWPLKISFWCLFHTNAETCRDREGWNVECANNPKKWDWSYCLCIYVISNVSLSTNEIDLSLSFEKK